MSARKATPRTRKASAPKASNGFRNAIKFLTTAQVGGTKGEPYQLHCSIANNWAIAYDGVLTVGHPIEEDLDACPHTFTLLDAIDKCSETLSVSIEASKLLVRSGRFRANVPCIDRSALYTPLPDLRCGNADRRLADALRAVSSIAAKSAESVAASSVLLQAGSAVATNCHVILEYWHGLSLPSNIIIPKSSATIIGKMDKDISGFGYSDRSFTVYYADNSWIKTQLYATSEWAPYQDVLDMQGVWFHPIPERLFEALEYLQPFGEHVFFRQAGDTFIASTSRHEGDGATYDDVAVPVEMAWRNEYLQLLKELGATKLDFSRKGAVRFIGEKVRGAIAGYTGV